MIHRLRVFEENLSLCLLVGLLLVLDIAYVPVSGGSLHTELLHIAIPIGVTVGLAGYALWLRQDGYAVTHVKQIALYGWIGAVVAAFGAVWLIEHFQQVLSVTTLLDEALTVVSIGIGLGVVLGTHITHEDSSNADTPRASLLSSHRETTSTQSGDRLLAQADWTNEPTPDPIATAITTQIAGIEGVDPLEVTSLQEYIDSDVFTILRRRDESRWQLLFYRDGYEIRVRSDGTVTIYDTEDPNDGHAVALSRYKQNGN